MSKSDSRNVSFSDLSSRRDDILQDRFRLNSFESLDYKQTDNVPKREFLRQLGLQKRLQLNHSITVFAKWIIYFIAGVLIGLLAVGIRLAVDQLRSIKFSLVEFCLANYSLSVTVAVFIAVNIVYVAIAFVSAVLGGVI
eukprot:TRINITY_DN1342_c1_g1_i1.p1 TRINITY_DN1342_c1_g1~~TRINITY_DN1342_c1_g1_i1.p1  ORF type:complete len:139 (+),score=23.18 TRINITY_DN1342_c1_g1_i1:40-456(+)